MFSPTFKVSHCFWYRHLVRTRSSPRRSNKDHSKNFQCLRKSVIVSNLFANFDDDWSCLGFKRVTKVRKRENLTSWPHDLSPKILQKFFLITCIKHLHVAKEDVCSVSKCEHFGFFVEIKTVFFWYHPMTSQLLAFV